MTDPAALLRLSAPCRDGGQHQRCTGVAWHHDRRKGPGPCECSCHTLEARAAAA
jgi:hypothetical protein